MIVYPAIDLRRGLVVRLRQGDPAAQTVYAQDPAEVARRWAELGAEWLHVVNLDGALDEGDGEGLPVNLRRLAEIRAATSLPIQFGGGIRVLDDMTRVLDLGATRVVLGTAAVRNPALVEAALARYGAARVVVGIDARDGLVAIHGWQQSAGLRALDLAIRMQTLGLERAVYTDIARDGMLTGANVSATASLARDSGLKVIASGGVGSIADIQAVAACQGDGIEGVILGQALYRGTVTLADALAAARM
jgi:phosphoribosylformimino-5-aminoimidazole carboxamide ribotide isomerase